MIDLIIFVDEKIWNNQNIRNFVYKIWRNIEQIYDENSRTKLAEFKDEINSGTV